jgi:hypothetical protein
MIINPGTNGSLLESHLNPSKAIIKRIEVGGQHRQIVHMTPSPK